MRITNDFQIADKDYIFGLYFVLHAGVTVSFFPPPVFPRGRIRPAHFFPGEETD